ncbi:DUF1304 domain-containing protein [Kingella negevensis]|uniref:DUF1304 domain-containing protein n=1 Tax=Kingella negevensis TaxID=1522312 RepID=A0A238HE20_9NEIS|nr:DUF1304 family protein [Kingella negevensis]MDK4679204.1 DUF1304 family protein [Kingella negevensis]MDK4683074.1 DUF1304 family protein [Kingella negevensis]MDK4683738.1 DUF1304 family protein [Kingella negevensis]MDK4688502.1 DUF1304 family protein [Kingella negevensis]MDK4691274.1 DUF1304 family protein [Kingella negevensis]
MLILTLILATITALTHFYIFFLEVPAFGTDKFRQVFRIPAHELLQVKPYFNNLGVYNLALALSATLGILLHTAANTVYLYGMANGLLFTALLTATAAGSYLAATAPDKRRAALIQAGPAFLGLLFLAFM